MSMLTAGRYAVSRAGEKAGFSIRPGTSKAMRGKTLLCLRMDDGKWKAVAFLQVDNSVRFFVKFAAENPPQILSKIREAVMEIAKNPEEARSMYFNSFLDIRKRSKARREP